MLWNGRSVVLVVGGVDKITTFISNLFGSIETERILIFAK